MGRNVEKSNGIGEVAGIEMPEIGVMTTPNTPEAARDADAEPVVVKKRKIPDEDLEPSLAPAPPQPENSGGDPAIPEECASPEIRHPVSSLNVDEEAQASGCSSYAESIARGKSEIADLEEEESTGEFEAASSWNSECSESGKTTPLREHETESDELSSNGTPPQWPPGDQSNSHVNAIRANIPSAAELEDFFSVAEQKIQKSFEDKYNFDVVNEKPLEGRYEWVQSVQPYNKEEEEEEDSSPSTAIPKKV